MNTSILIFIKGLIVGGTMLVPGVSGGSMAMMLGIYQRLISSIGSFFQNVKANFLFLGLFCLGGGAGILLFANPILQLLEAHRMNMMYFFLGAVAGGIPIILKCAKVKTFQWKCVLELLIGMLCIAGLAYLPKDIFLLETNMLFLIIAGFIAAIALVLPGISVSYVLLMLGLYDQMMVALTTGDLLFLMPLGIGLLLGILATTKLLERCLSRHPQATYLIVLGFLLGSLMQIFPGFPTGIDLIVCPILFLIGYGFLSWLSTKEQG